MEYVEEMNKRKEQQMNALLILIIIGTGLVVGYAFLGFLERLNMPL